MPIDVEALRHSPLVQLYAPTSKKAGTSRVKTSERMIV